MIQPAVIKTVRQAQGLTQLEVAIRVGVSYPAYRLWETGGTKPTEDNEFKLRNVLKIGGQKNDGSENRD